MRVNDSPAPTSLNERPYSPISHPAKTPLMEGVGERKVTMMLDRQGGVEVSLSASPVTSLVLSGGGAKGVAFSGVVAALEDAGKLQGIQSVHGSSAGAISAALIASGMGVAAFDHLSDNIDLPSLLNTKDPVGSWVQDAGTKLGKLVGKLPGSVGNISQLLMTVVPRLQTEAIPLEELIRKESRQSVLAHIEKLSSKAPLSVEVESIKLKLEAGGATTFGDLEVLSRDIPAIKQLSITGTGMFAGRPQLVVFSAELTRHMDIAQAAHISGSLPFVFESPKEQGHGFQASGETTAFQDGGLLLNTPAPGLVQKSFHESPLSTPEALIVQFEAPPTNASVRSGSFGSSIADRLTGVPFNAANAFQNKGLEAFADQVVTLPLKTENIDARGAVGGTLNFAIKKQHKDDLQEKARQAVETHLEHRATKFEHHRFQSLDAAVLAMDDKLLASVQPTLQKRSAAEDVLKFREDARQVLDTLDSAIAGANQSAAGLAFTPEILSAIKALETLTHWPERNAWLGRCLNVANNSNFQQFLQAAVKHAAGGVFEMGQVVDLAVAEMNKRDIEVKAQNFTQAVIYPSLYRPGHPKSNVKLLNDAIVDMAAAQTPSQFNKVIDSIIEGYKARNKPWETARSATTVEMAQAWRLPV